jgi:hypothetical protein
LTATGLPERLPAQLEAAALLRQAEAEGGFGTIVKRGDPDRGALVLLITRRGEHHACLERALSPRGDYRWQAVGPSAGADGASLADWSQKRVRFDEDLWLIELDIPDPERFIAETTSTG